MSKASDKKPRSGTSSRWTEPFGKPQRLMTEEELDRQRQVRLAMRLAAKGDRSYGREIGFFPSED